MLVLSRPGFQVALLIGLAQVLFLRGCCPAQLGVRSAGQLVLQSGVESGLVVSSSSNVGYAYGLTASTEFNKTNDLEFSPGVCLVSLTQTGQGYRLVLTQKSAFSATAMSTTTIRAIVYSSLHISPQRRRRYRAGERGFSFRLVSEITCDVYPHSEERSSIHEKD